ncbi:MAG: BamA/TamA family outer membrane protein, partial [Pirellula sp.]
IEERNFDLFKLPGRPSDLFNGAFRGAGQNFRLELVPGNQVQRYTMNWTEPNLFGYSPFSLSVGGFYFTRFFRDWSEQRLGGRAALGYDITPDLSVSTELRGEDVKVFNPRVRGVEELEESLGSSDLYTARFR